MYKIRCSMLPGYPDCPRRAVAKQYPWLLKEAGFEVRKLMPSAGAAVGTAVHTATESMLDHKIHTGQLGHADVGIDKAIAKFREEVAPGVEWDDTTPTMDVAEFQIWRLTYAYGSIANEIDPAEVEMELTATISPDWELTGHIDVYTKDCFIDDTKTGAIKRPYQAQLGGYSLLCKSHGLAVSGIGTTYIHRSKKTNPQQAPERQQYDLAVSEEAAFSTISAIIRDVTEFEKTGNPYTFQANPMSLMCSEKYCPAWGTSFCKLHLNKQVLKNDVD